MKQEPATLLFGSILFSRLGFIQDIYMRPVHYSRASCVWIKLENAVWKIKAWISSKQHPENHSCGNRRKCCIFVLFYASQRFKVGQHFARHGWSLQAGWFWHVQRKHNRRQDHSNVLRHPRLYSSGGMWIYKRWWPHMSCSLLHWYQWTCKYGNRGRQTDVTSAIFTTVIKSFITC